MEQVLKVLVADDHPLILQGLRRTLEACDDIEVVGEARSGTEVLALVERRRPDVVLLDLRMPGLDGVACIKQIKQSSPEVKAVILSGCDDRPSIESAQEAGASAYVIKSVSSVDIPALLRQVAAGYTLFQAPNDPPPTPMRRGSGAYADRARADDPHVGRRRPDDQGDQLGAVGERAHGQVPPHEHLPQARSVTNRSGAVRYAYEHGLVPPAG